MADWVTPEAIRAARRADLCGYLLAEHPGEVEEDYDGLRLKRDHSVSIKTGWSGYYDFGTAEGGNAIECLTRFLGYDFVSAVASICSYIGFPYEPDPGAAAGPRTIDVASLLWSAPRPPQAPRPAPERVPEPPGPPAEPRAFLPPERVRTPYYQLFAYLMRKREIPADTIQRLVRCGVLYQACVRGHHNMVFINPESTFAEIRGTTDVPFHGIAPGSGKEDFWWFKSGPMDSDATVAYVCESAIDAVSLHLLRASCPDAAGLEPMRPGENALYCSIAGVANQQRVDRIKAGMGAAGCETVIAVDNDDAGESCRQRNPDCRAIMPHAKDWNEDWIAAVRAGRTA